MSNDDGAWGDLIEALVELLTELPGGWWSLLVLFVLVTAIAYCCWQ